MTGVAGVEEQDDPTARLRERCPNAIPTDTVRPGALGCHAGRARQKQRFTVGELYAVAREKHDREVVWAHGFEPRERRERSLHRDLAVREPGLVDAGKPSLFYGDSIAERVSHSSGVVISERELVLGRQLFIGRHAEAD